MEIQPEVLSSLSEKTSRCELILKNGKLYIRPIEGDGIFLNGSAIISSLDGDQEVLLPLSDQDQLGFFSDENPLFQLMVEDSSGQQMDELWTSFTSSSSSNDDTLDDDDSDTATTTTPQSWNTVFNDPALLSLIFSYLPFSTLKSIRQVCPQWKKESQKYFLPLSTISLQPSPWITDWEKEFHKYSENVGEYGHQNFKVCYSGQPCDGWIEEDVLFFVGRHGAMFKSLEVIIMPGRNDLAFLRDILSNSSLTNLAQLTVTIFTNQTDYTTHYWPVDTIVLPSVKALTLNLAFESQPPQQLLDFAPAFLNSFPAIEAFQLNADDSTDCLLEHPIMLEFVAGIEQSYFINLSEIRLQWVTASVMDILIDFPHPLKVIDVHFDRVEVDTGRVQGLLDKHCGALEELGFGVHSGEGLEMSLGQPGVELPSFPKLKKVAYTFYFGESVEDLEIGDVDLLGLRGVFLSGSDNFKNQFPVLTRLHLILSGRHVEELFQQLFPAKDSQGNDLNFPQIREFRTKFPSCVGGKPLFPWVERIAAMFPNARGTELEILRGQQEWGNNVVEDENDGDE